MHRLFALTMVFASAAALAGCGMLTAKEGEPAGEEKGEEHVVGHVTVKAEAAKRETVQETVEGLGTCEALPEGVATLNPAVEGHVKKIMVKPGDIVKAGDPIVLLDESLAKADVAEKTALRDGLKSSLKLLTSLPRPDERKSSELAIDQAKIAVEKAKRIAERLHRLRPGEIGEQQLWEADQAVEQARIAQATAEAQLKVMMIGPRTEAIAEAEAKIATADATLQVSLSKLEYLTIRSPIAGMVEDITCHPGQTIAVGSPIGEVVDTSRVIVLLHLPTKSAALVKPGQVAQIHSSAAGAGGESSAATEIQAKVEFVGRVADAQTGNIPVHVLAENPSGLLSLGEMVNVEIVVKETPEQMLIPTSALADQGEGAVFSVIRGDKSVVLKPKSGISHGGWVQVEGTDLKPGELVITEGGYNLPEGTEVELAKPEEEKKEGDDEKDEHEKSEKSEKSEKAEAKGEKADEHEAKPAPKTAAKSAADHEKEEK